MNYSKEENSFFISKKTKREQPPRRHPDKFNNIVTCCGGWVILYLKKIQTIAKPKFVDKNGGVSIFGTNDRNSLQCVISYNIGFIH